MTQQRGRKLSSVKIAAMEQDWITSTVQPERKELAQKHGVSESTVKRYHAQGKWTLKRRAYWENLNQVVGQVSQVALAQASKQHSGSGDHHIDDESVERARDAVGHFIAEVVNSPRDEFIKMLTYLNDTLMRVFQNVTTANDKPLVITSETSEEGRKAVRQSYTNLELEDGIKCLPGLIKAITDIQRIQEVMQGRPDSRVEIVGTPQDLSPYEEAALEVVQRIRVRGRGEGSE